MSRLTGICTATGPRLRCADSLSDLNTQLANQNLVFSKKAHHSSRWSLSYALLPSNGQGDIKHRCTVHWSSSIQCLEGNYPACFRCFPVPDSNIPDSDE